NLIQSLLGHVGAPREGLVTQTLRKPHVPLLFYHPARASVGRAKIILDNEWFPGEVRYKGGPSRYLDLQNRTEGTIVIEIGCGEPPDLCQPGATTGALEWIEVLDRQGRAVHPFLLWAEWPAIRANMQSKRSLEILWARLWHEAYRNQIDVVSLPKPLADIEQQIKVDGKSAKEVAAEILAIIGLP
ncbi:MAG: hypothetical protein ACR2FY_16305, partial [Pirellulaceae bacterium]